MNSTKIWLIASLISLFSSINLAFASDAHQAYKVANLKMTNVLNVRQNPSMNSTVILQLPADARWILKRTTQQQGHWQKVVWGVKEGWVYNNYISVDQEATQFLTKHRQCVQQSPENSMCCGFNSSSKSRNSQVNNEIRTFMVVNVPRGQSLNVRAAGRATARKISNIPHSAAGIVKFPGQLVNQGHTVWQKIRWNGRDGWVNASYLQYDPIISDYRNIVHQVCS